MTLYLIHPLDDGKWALVTRASKKTVVTFDRYERVAAFVDGLPETDRSSIDVSRVEDWVKPIRGNRLHAA